MRTKGSKRCLQVLFRGRYGFLRAERSSSVCMSKLCGRFLVCDSIEWIIVPTNVVDDISANAIKRGIYLL